jgi:hypothetical protein
METHENKKPRGKWKVMIDADFIKQNNTEEKKKRLTGNLLRFYILLQSYARNKHVCYPSRFRLAKELGCTIRTIDNYKRALESMELLTWEHRLGKDGRLKDFFFLADMGEKIVSRTEKRFSFDTRKDVPPNNTQKMKKTENENNTKSLVGETELLGKESKSTGKVLSKESGTHFPSTNVDQEGVPALAFKYLDLYAEYYFLNFGKKYEPENIHAIRNHLLRGNKNSGHEPHRQEDMQFYIEKPTRFLWAFMWCQMPFLGVPPKGKAVRNEFSEYVPTRPLWECRRGSDHSPIILSEQDVVARLRAAERYAFGQSVSDGEREMLRGFTNQEFLLSGIGRGDIIPWGTIFRQEHVSKEERDRLMADAVERVAREKEWEASRSPRQKELAEVRKLRAFTGEEWDEYYGRPKKEEGRGESVQERGEDNYMQTQEGEKDEAEKKDSSDSVRNTDNPASNENEAQRAEIGQACGRNLFEAESEEMTPKLAKKDPTPANIEEFERELLAKIREDEVKAALKKNHEVAAARAE